MIELRPVDSTNWVEIARLPLPAEQQRFLAPNLWSIAEMQFEYHYVAPGIYAGHEVVGFAMYRPDNAQADADTIWIFRFMIGADYQGRGFGISALARLDEEIRAGGTHQLRIMHGPENRAAARLYERAGFQPVGELEDGDIELELDLRQDIDHLLDHLMKSDRDP